MNQTRMVLNDQALKVLNVIRDAGAQEETKEPVMGVYRLYPRTLTTGIKCCFI